MGKIYVGNLPYRTSEEAVKAHFEQCGPVSSVKIITDRESGRSRGFCFVEMDDSEKAIAELNNADFEGRQLRISQAIDKQRRR